MTFTVEQKSQLARLMATENLTVQHQKIQTAKFDPTNRILYLPIWQNMSGFMYDLLTGHEVGHALYTPADGWHDVATDKTKGRFYKNFLNVVEDARIEKKVQRKYPGLRSSFAKAYNELMNRDFFGIKGKEVNGLPFIDRLNLYTKSQYSSSWIEFNTVEEVMIEKIKKLETWEEVVKLTEEIYDYSKEEQSEIHQEMYSDFDYNFDEENEFGDYDSDGFGDDYEESENDSPETNGSNEEDSDESIDEENDGDGSGENTGKSSKSDKKENTNDLDGQDSGKLNRFKDSSPFEGEDDFHPRCETDETFRENETVLLDEKSKEYVYINMPEPILERIVTPWKRVQEQLTDYYKMECKEYSYRMNEAKIKSWVHEFKNKNERYIGLLAKEFEMRKAAKSFSKSKLCDTGDIDINKLASYKFDDNIFRKVMLTPKGKSHGLVLLLDKSGSMMDNMSGSIEQILVLTMFCRKVNIPFIVYGFGDSSESLVADFNLDKNNSNDDISKYYECFEQAENMLVLGSVRLREYLNSTMTNAEFSMALRNMVCLKKSFEGYRNRGQCGRPYSEDLSNTPLTQAIVATATIMKNFKRKHNLDMTSLVVVHDGDADYLHGYLKYEDRVNTNTGEMEKRLCEKYFYGNSQNVILCDRKNKIQQKISPSKDHLIYDVLTWFQKTTGSKVFGFFLTGTTGSPMRNAIYNRYFFEDGTDFSTLRAKNYSEFDFKLKELVKKFKKEKFLVTRPAGYNEFFLIVGGNELQTENDELDVGEGKVTSSKLKMAFMKYNKNKAVNRVLVSKFIQGIAA